MRKTLNVDQAAERLGLAVQTLYRWRSEKHDMPKGFTIGNRLRWYEDVVDDWMEAQYESAAA